MLLVDSFEFPLCESDLMAVDTDLSRMPNTPLASAADWIHQVFIAAPRDRTCLQEIHALAVLTIYESVFI